MLRFIDDILSFNDHQCFHLFLLFKELLNEAIFLLQHLLLSYQLFLQLGDNRVICHVDRWILLKGGAGSQWTPIVFIIPKHLVKEWAPLGVSHWLTVISKIYVFKVAVKEVTFNIILLHRWCSYLFLCWCLVIRCFDILKFDLLVYWCSPKIFRGLRWHFIIPKWTVSECTLLVIGDRSLHESALLTILLLGWVARRNLRFNWFCIFSFVLFIQRNRLPCLFH